MTKADRMLIESVHTTPLAGDRVEVGATFLGQPLYFRLPQSRLCREALGDALTLSVLAPAMRAGVPIRLPDDIPVSSKLAASLEGIQRIWKGWNVALQPVRLEAQLYQPVAAQAGIGLFYAGGVDSSYSVLSHDEVELLITVYGFDLFYSESEMAANLERNTRFAKMLGKELATVETNHSRFVRDLGISRTLIYGATLASIAHLLGLARCYIASSHSTVNLRPSGSHPALDARFSNGRTEIVHDDVSVSRLEKTLAVAARPEILENLRVCWDYPNENCGECWKCLRTMTMLRLRGITGPFPAILDARRIRAMAAHSEVEYVISILLAAHANGDRELAKAVRHGLRRQDRREALRYLDLAFLGGRLHRLRRRFQPERDLFKVDTRPDLTLG